MEGRRNGMHKVQEQGPRQEQERSHKEQHAEVLTEEQQQEACLEGEKQSFHEKHWQDMIADIVVGEPQGTGRRVTR